MHWKQNTEDNVALAEKPAEEIWVVEDNPADARLVREALRDSLPSCRVRVFEDGESILAVLRRSVRDGCMTQPTLVLLDLNLPRMSGHDTLAAIKADRILCHIPIIIFSTSRAEDDQQRAYALGAAGYLVKPRSWNEYTRIGETIGEYWRIQRAIQSESLGKRAYVEHCATKEIC